MGVDALFFRDAIQQHRKYEHLGQRRHQRPREPKYLLAIRGPHLTDHQTNDDRSGPKQCRQRRKHFERAPIPQPSRRRGSYITAHRKLFHRDLLTYRGAPHKRDLGIHVDLIDGQKFGGHIGILQRHILAVYRIH